MTDGSSATYTVKLITQPTGNVTVSVAGDESVTVNPSSLTFTASNFTSTQNVTVSDRHQGN